MGGNMKDRWSVPVTAVANEFIDTYMAAANGEYVKVYLYVLRHQGEDITVELIAGIYKKFSSLIFKYLHDCRSQFVPVRSVYHSKAKVAAQKSRIFRIPMRKVHYSCDKAGLQGCAECKA